jgi:YCII-related domain
VSLRNGKLVVLDGPFADTKEQIGGFVVVEVPDLKSALDWAARYPAGEGRPGRGPAQPARNSATGPVTAVKSHNRSANGAPLI